MPTKKPNPSASVSESVSKSVSKSVSSSVAPATDPFLAPESPYAAAFARHRAEIEALDPASLPFINVDIPTVTTMVHAHLKRIRALRDELARMLPDYDLARFDALASCTDALSFTHAGYLVASTPPPVLPELSEEAVALRAQLELELTVLARRGLVDGGRLSQLKGPVGYKNVAYDLLAIALLVRESWAAIEGKSSIERADVERCEHLGRELLTAVAAREEKPEHAAAAALLRQRAFALFASTYDHVRRAVAFLRWDEGDADDIAPSLYAGRSNGRRKEVQDPPAAPLPTNGAPAVGTSPANPRSFDEN